MRTHFSRPPLTVALEDRDYPEWRRGRERYGIWMIDADTAPVRERVAQARQTLDGLFTPHRRLAHITLFICGFINEPAQLDDDFDSAMLARQRTQLANARIAPFTLHIGGIDSFDSAAFLHVTDRAGGLRRIRAALTVGQTEVCPGRYTPHLTVGLYRAAFAKREVRQRMAPLATLPPLDLTVRDIVFAGYAAKELDGPLEVIERLPLGD
ncbi:2'-5' RNA ligase family protein [Rhodocyclus tenuis]|uniref:2'-5' RNA ligase family protein n=2 Tax=Rhodocyclus TaxID=1064 RepID=A0A6L5JY42_RHOTE|nr:2'-5' RNA ligase family protein [Rhodocyclus gracilis]MQY51961.1 2'-5' RNA ligase family protein [Rhodocyclus gracilis]MRD73739.1 2'-5' RNA ligase family protein [Rhodocyclus gracilis]NJA89785.1 2'-5' RNA ligase family protein [Rhodocyclus gracilis]